MFDAVAAATLFSKMEPPKTMTGDKQSEARFRATQREANGVAKTYMDAMSSRRSASRLNTKAAWNVIDPREAWSCNYWESLTSLCLVFIAVFTPVEVAFLGSASTVDVLFWINRSVDLIFGFDMIYQSMLGYHIEATGRWEMRQPHILKHYLKGWFAFDLFSLLISAVGDTVSVLLTTAAEPAALNGTSTGGGSSASSDSSSFSPSKLKILRVIRVLRIMKLIRLLRGSATFKRIEMTTPVNYSLVAISRSMVLLLMGSHWFACVWGMQAMWAQDVRNTWIGELGEPCADGTHDGWPQCLSPAMLYVTSLYFSVYTITSIGYGDVSASKTNGVELTVNVFLMLFGGCLWGYVVAVLVGEVSTFNVSLSEFRKLMNDLNRMMSGHRLTKGLQQQLREYMLRSRHLREAKSHKALMQHLSPTLRGEVSWQMNAQFLESVKFLQDAPRAMSVQLSMALQPVIFPPGDIAPPSFLYIIHRGIALYRGQLLGERRVWGEDMVLESLKLRMLFTARAMNYVDVFFIGRETLFLIAEAFPEVLKRIRRFAFILALRRDVVLRASLMKYNMVAREDVPGMEASRKSILSAPLPLVPELGMMSKMGEKRMAPAQAERLYIAAMHDGEKGHAGLMTPRNRPTSAHGDAHRVGRGGTQGVL